VRIALLIGRLILGAVFLYAAYLKLHSPWYIFAASIDAYRMLPPWAVEFIARTLPWFELVLGLVLLTGYKLRWVAMVSGIILLAFWVSMLWAFAKGLGIDCGCFGPGEKVSYLTLIRDGALVALAAFLCWKATPRSVEI
jgi:putative oxidoreductase